MPLHALHPSTVALISVPEERWRCWEWLGYRTKKGYGRCVRGGRRWRVHRLVWTELRGEIPAGMVIDHLCRNPACCNPDHMEVVRPGENVRRGMGAAMKTHCKEGHPLDGVRPSGARFCRTCAKECSRRWRRRLDQSGREEMNRKRREWYAKNAERQARLLRERRARRGR